MCGIAGIYAVNQTDLNKNRSRCVSMLESMTARGPDNRGVHSHGTVVFGHNRLSIIDLDKRSSQPFEYGPVSLTFNGEIYNYKELKAELKSKGYIFTTESDTEVICASYLEWGRNCVNRFNGMWAFALLNKSDQTLFCSRDRFGIKPFYFIWDENQFIFASEVKALKRDESFDNELNEGHILRYLQLGWLTFKDQTFFEKIRSIRPGHNLNIKDGRLKVERYWDIKHDDSKKEIEVHKNEWRELLIDAVRIHMRSDVPVGGCLSGGLDSSALCGIISTLFPKTKLKTFTAYYENVADERPFVKSLCNQYEGIEPYFIEPNEDDILQYFEDFFENLDFPPAGSSPFSQYQVMKLAKENGVKVVIDGQGADEILGGYNHSLYRRSAGFFQKWKISQGLAEINNFIEMGRGSASQKIPLIQKSLLASILSENQLYRLEYKRHFPFLGKIDLGRPDLHQPSKIGSRLNQFLYQLTSETLLPTLLHYEDRNSMCFSIESRVPFLDYRLVEKSFDLPDELKWSDGWNKVLLRNGFKDIIPSTIYNRTDKMGFVTPGEEKWLRGPMAPLLNKAKSLDLPFLSKSKINKVISEYESGDNSKAKLVWRLAMLHKWVSQF